MNRLRYQLLLLPLLLLLGCSPNKRKPAPPVDPVSERAPMRPLVTANSKELLFRYKGEDGWHQALSIAEIPVDSRGKVQVIDLGAPPKARNASQFVHVFNLTSPAADGTFPGQTIKRLELESMMRTQDQPVQAEPVIMYSTSWCGVCKKASRFMTKQGISFLEKDIEKDKAAARELNDKRRKHGIQGNGVPVFDVNGKMMSGFDPNRLQALIGSQKKSVGVSR